MDCIPLLRKNEHLAHLSPEQLSFLAKKGSIKSIPKGEFLFEKDKPADDLIFVCQGRFRIFTSQKDEEREVAQLGPGDITGVLPYSRMTHARGYCKAMEDGQALYLHKSHFREMINDNHALTEALVHLMSSRIREFTTSSMQNEKLMSLGKLSAGLAHELNNPASAMVRSSSALVKHLKLTPENFKNVMNMKVSAEQVERVSEVLFELAQRPDTGLALMERTRREDELTDLLDTYDLDDSLQLAEEIVDFGMIKDDILRLHEITGARDFAPTLRWLVGNLTTERSVKEINNSAVRIAELIGSIKEYSHMDSTKDRQPVDVNQGLQSTLKMLAHKARANKVEVDLDLASNLPKMSGFPGELNQVWTNLIDNALDAMEPEGGVLKVHTSYAEPWIVVTVGDTGVGIPAETKNKIFDPFFTTKAVGKGTGLGLDIAGKIIRKHKGLIDVESVPGDTRFKLSLPLK